MKYMDKVKVITQKDKYKKNNISIGEIGTIINAEIRDNDFYVVFDNNNEFDWYKYCEINVGDLELVEDGKYTDQQILQDLPRQNPAWWCKVENGYIKNLLGDKKNKIPYDYNS